MLLYVHRAWHMQRTDIVLLLLSSGLIAKYNTASCAGKGLNQKLLPRLLKCIIKVCCIAEWHLPPPPLPLLRPTLAQSCPLPPPPPHLPPLPPPLCSLAQDLIPLSSSQFSALQTGTEFSPPPLPWQTASQQPQQQLMNSLVLQPLHQPHHQQQQQLDHEEPIHASFHIHRVGHYELYDLLTLTLCEA